MQIAKFTEKYVKRLRHLLDPLFIEKAPAPTTERCCLTLADNNVHLVALDKLPATNNIICSEVIRCEEFDMLPVVLSSIASRYQLKDMPVYWLLSPDDYQLFLIESLPVTQAELLDAVRWRVRSLINYPSEEAIIDFFKLPPQKGSTHSMVAAIAARSNRLTILKDIIKQCGLNLTVIDVPELAMRNLSSLYENDEKSTAFIYLYGQYVILNISRQKILYFTRRIALPTFAESHEIDYEQFSLELLRYFDYFQCQWRHPSPNRIFISAEQHSITDVAKKLSEFLLLSVEPFHLTSIAAQTEQCKLLESKNLLTLGCALREDASYAAPRH